jgi:hypothetical protein
MADRYIDQEETQIYGPHASKQIRALAMKLVPAYDPALKHIVEELDSATAAMGQVLKSSRVVDSSRREGIERREPLLTEALKLIGRFSKHLDSHKAGLIDRKRFLPGGVIAGIGKSAPRVLLALSHMAQELSRKDSPVLDAKSWHKEFATAAATLAPAVAVAGEAAAARRDITPAIEEARSAWLQIYVAARCTVEAVLRLTGKLNLMTVIFYDLAVPATAKVTAPPPPSPAAPAGALKPAAPAKRKKPSPRKK